MHHPHESPGVSRNGYTPISAFDSQTHEDSTSTELVQDMSKIHALFPRCRQMAGWYTGGIWLRQGGWTIALVSVASRSDIHQRQPWWRRPWMLSLCLASSSAIRATLYSSLLLEHWLSQGLEAGWHPPAGSFLYPGSVFPAVDIVLCSSWIWATKVLTFCVCPHSRLFPHTAVPSPPGPPPVSQDISHCPQVLVSSDLRLFFPVHEKWITRGTGQSAAHWEVFPFTAVGSPLKDILQGLPWAGLWSMVLAPAYSADPSALV